MASSGSFNTSSCEGRYLIFSWSLSSQSIENNTSTISWKLVGAGSSGYVVVSEVKVVINGAQVYYRDTSNTVNCYQGTVVASGTVTIAHNTDGSKSFSASVGAGIYQWAINCNGSGSWALTTIPRASSLSLSASSVNVGSSITANISRASSSFTHAVEFYINSTYYQKYTGVATSQSYTIPTSWYAAMPSSTSCTAYCRITTYSGSTQIGSQVTKSFTVAVPSSIVPTVGTITLDPVDINSKNILVQGKNKFTLSVSGCSAGTGSSIKSYTFSGNGLSTTTTTSTSVSGGPISNSGKLSYTVTVTDNRGRVASKTISYDNGNTLCYSYAYSTPYFSSFNAYRSDSSGTADNNGAYIKCSYNLGFSSVNSTNDVTVKIMYKKSSAPSYSSVTSLTNSTSTSGSQILSSIALDSTYAVYATITDNYSGSSSSQTITIFGASRVLNITSDGTGVAFGKMAESTKLLESRYKIKAPGLMSTRDGRTNTSLNIAADEEHLGCLEYYIVKSGTTGAPPSVDGHVIHCHWDNTGGWDAQLLLNNTTGEMMSRGCNGGGWGNWMAVQYKPTILYSGTGTVGTVPLSSSAANFTYLEIFYTDNNSRPPQSIKLYSPNGKYVSLSCVEPSTSGTEPRAYIRTSGWTISGTTMTPGRSDLDGANRGVYAQIYPHASGTNIDVNVTANNYIKIVRILGYA